MYIFLMFCQLGICVLFPGDIMSFSTVASLSMRAFSSSAVRQAVQHVTIIGGGLMGSGIAQVLTLLLHLL